MEGSNHKSIEVKDFTIDCRSFDEEQCRKTFIEYGVCVLENAFTEAFCDQKVDEIVSIFESFGTGVDRNNPATMSGYSVPIESKPGMFHGLVGNFPPVWEIRTAPIIKRVFATLYGRECDYIVSSDGFTLTPNQAYPQPADWPHVDQTVLGLLKCIQGQVALANTTASFICSPKSHNLHQEALRMYDATNRHGNFLRLDSDEEKLNHLKKRHVGNGGTWQIPIQVRKGSVIFWASSLIHSARPTVVQEAPCPSDPWKGWRCAIYVCLRPVDDLTDEEIRLRAASLMKNRQTNHWCSVVFPTRPGDRATDKHPTMESLIDNPAFVYKYCKKPDLNDPSVRELSGIDIATKKNAELRELLKIYTSDNDLTQDQIAEKLAAFHVTGLNENTYNITDAVQQNY